MKKLFLVIGVTAFIAVVAVNVSIGLRNNALSDLVLANIEALAQTETSDEYKENTGGCDPSWDPKDVCRGQRPDGTSCAWGASIGTCTN